MSEIELVIKIDKEDYEIMKHNIAIDNPLCPLNQREMVAKIANGTPLSGTVINSLEQKPCKDTISRSETLTAMIKELGIKNEDYLLQAEKKLYEIVKNMPPVTPTQEPVLDKVRAEIEAIIGEKGIDDYDYCSGLICARNIIDKHKAEITNSTTLAQERYQDLYDEKESEDELCM